MFKKIKLVGAGLAGFLGGNWGRNRVRFAFLLFLVSQHLFLINLDLSYYKIFIGILFTISFIVVYYMIEDLFIKSGFPLIALGAISWAQCLYLLKLNTFSGLSFIYMLIFFIAYIYIIATQYYIKEIINSSYCQIALLLCYILVFFIPLLYVGILNTTIVITFLICTFLQLFAVYFIESIHKLGFIIPVICFVLYTYFHYEFTFYIIVYYCVVSLIILFVYFNKNKFFPETFIKDNITIETHLNTEFWVLSLLRKVLLVNFFLLFFYSKDIFRFFRLDPLEAYSEYSIQLSLMIFFILLIRAIIINFCNVKVEMGLFQNCVNCAIGVGIWTNVGQVYHFSITQAGAHPAKLPFTPYLQGKLLGYKYDTAAGGILATGHRLLIGPIPINDDLTINEMQIRLNFANRGIYLRNLGVGGKLLGVKAGFEIDPSGTGLREIHIPAPSRWGWFGAAQIKTSTVSTILPEDIELLPEPKLDAGYKPWNGKYASAI